MKKIFMMALCGLTACMFNLSADESAEVASCGGSNCRRHCGCHKDCGGPDCHKKTECHKKCGGCHKCKKPCDKPKKQDSCKDAESQNSSMSSDNSSED